MRFGSQMQQAGTEEERNRIRAEHQNMIRERAGDLGVAAPFGPDRSAYGTSMRSGYMLSQMLTEQERQQFHQRMRSAAGDQDRERIRSEMQITARERARELGVEIPDWYGAGNGR